jgi:diaminopimelate decarboxylase
MDHFQLRDGELFAEDVPLSRIAEEVGTPVYVYSRATLERHATVFRDALAAIPRKHIAFAVKSNPNLAVLRVLGRQGYGADARAGRCPRCGDRPVQHRIGGRRPRTRPHRRAARDACRLRP